MHYDKVQMLGNSLIWLVAKVLSRLFLFCVLHTHYLSIFLAFTFAIEFIQHFILPLQPPSTYLTSIFIHPIVIPVILFPPLCIFLKNFLSVPFCAGVRAISPEELKVLRVKMILKWLGELWFFETRCDNAALRCWSCLFSSLAYSQRPTLAARGEVITMTASSQDCNPSFTAGLLLLLLLPAVFTQNSAVPTTSPPPLFDPLTQRECTKKEHPKVSIQGLTSSKAMYKSEK